MSDTADFIDAALQYEVSPYAYPTGTDVATEQLARYGTSVGAIRGTIRDALKRYPGMTHDQVTALSSELWTPPAFERRSAAIVLLQTFVAELRTSDLTRIEGFIRTAASATLVDQLVADVLAPMLAAQDVAAAAKASVVIERWQKEPAGALRGVGERLSAGTESV